jgi:3-methyl-2-oxobutanoate hydroxymethyltransferase
MPFLSFQLSPEQALANAGRLIKESDAQAVKLEGGERTAPAIERMVAAGIPVMAHVGLTPQSVRQFGGFKVQRDGPRLKTDVKAVESAGAFAVVVECVPVELAAELTALVKIPTIGIGAGNQCDGQVLVGADMLGLFDDVRPKFVKRFGELGAAARQAAEAYCRDVRSGAFPGPDHSFR